MDTFAPPSSQKRKEEPPSSSSDVGEKVCILCTSVVAQPIEGRECDRFHLYVVDLSADGYGGPRVGRRLPFKLPTFTIAHRCLPSIHNICVLGSTLYILDGYNRNNNTTGGKSFYTYEFPSNVLSLSNFRIEREMLKKIPDMNKIKGFPISIPTPDKKGILVFSSVIGKDLRSADEAAAQSADYCDPNLDEFEMYQPSVGSWQRFAGIPMSWRTSRFMIISYAFFDNQNVLLVNTDNIGMFTLDLSLPDQPCRRLPSPLHPPKCSGCSILARGHLFLGPEFASDDGGVLTFSYPGLSNPETSCEMIDSRITLLRVDDSERKFCIMQSYTDSVTLCPHLIVNVYKLDLDEYMKRKGEEEYKVIRGLYHEAPLLPAVEIVKSFEYSLSAQVFDDSFHPWGFFSTQRGN